VHSERARRSPSGASRCLLEVELTSGRLERRHDRTLAPQERQELIAEALTCDAVEEEVDGVVETSQLMDNSSTSVVRSLRESAGVLPPVSADR